MASYNIYDAKTHLSSLIEKVCSGEEVVIARAGKPVARLLPMQEPASRERRSIRDSFGANHGDWGDVDAILSQPLSEEEQRAFGMHD